MKSRLTVNLWAGILIIRNSGTVWHSGTNYDWTTPQNDNLWKDGAKTLFDPCPPGWRVPKSGSDATVNPWYSFSTDHGLWSGTEVTAGWTFQATIIHGGTAWYPALGCRNRGNGLLFFMGNRGHSQSSTVNNNNNSNFWYSPTGVNSSNAHDRAYTIAVRCIRE